MTNRQEDVGDPSLVSSRTSWPKQKSRKATRRKMKECFYSELQMPETDSSKEKREMYIREKGRQRKVNKRLMSLQCSPSHSCSEPGLY